MSDLKPWGQSGNYARLYDLVRDGVEVPCNINYEDICRDVCHATNRFRDVNVGVRGYCYFSAKTETEFERLCAKHDLRWIDPRGCPECAEKDTAIERLREAIKSNRRTEMVKALADTEGE